MSVETLSLSNLVAAYNAITGKSIKSFQSRAVGAARVEAAAAEAGVSVVVSDGQWEVVDAAEDAEPAAPAAEEAPAAEAPAIDPESLPRSFDPTNFVKLTREELAVLAEVDPEARAAYRKARRKAARLARKAVAPVVAADEEAGDE